MRKLLNTSMVYFILAMVGGVFFREFTKFNNYTDPTTLGLLHVHMLVLGTLLFIIIALIYKQTDLKDDKLFNKFYILYNISLPLMIIMMTIRGIVQVRAISLTSGMNGMISGIAGLSHIGMLISLAMLLIAIRRNLLKN